MHRSKEASFDHLIGAQDDPLFRRAAKLLVAVVLIWGVVKLSLRPDDYTAAVMALHVFDPAILAAPMVGIFAAAVSLYTLALIVFWRLNPSHAPFYAGALVAALLVAYWTGFDTAFTPKIAITCVPYCWLGRRA